MSSAQAMEEELQQSVLRAEDAEFDTVYSAAGSSTRSNARRARSASRQDYSDDDEVLSDRDASGEELDQDASGEEDNDLLARQIIVGSAAPDRDEDGEEIDEDAEGEEDLDEGVGAVKIRPGESDNDEDAESDVSDLPSAAEEESDDDEAMWDEADGADEDEESDAALPNTCIFCKQDEENDPSEDFEAFLACSRCSDNAHQQCARDAISLTEENNAQSWKCPDCLTAELEPDDDDVDQADETKETPSVQRSSSRRSDTAKLSSEKMSTDGRSDSNDRDLDRGSTESFRARRKRKSSYTEPDEEGSGPVRKRRRNVSNDATVDDGGIADQSTELARPRTLRLKVMAAAPIPVTVVKHSRTSLVIKIQVRPGNLKEILSRRRRHKKHPGGAGTVGVNLGSTPGGISRPVVPPRLTPARPTTAPAPTPLSALPTPFTSDLYSQPFYSFFDKETDDAKGKPYGGILSEIEADTSKTLPMPDDRKRFDQAKQKAEDEWRTRIMQMQGETETPLRKHKKNNDNVSQIECIEFGGWEIDTWYAAPYPAEYSRNRVLYICEFCLKYMNSDYVAWRHKLKCPTKHPPGDEIYRHGSVSIFEVDGRKHPVYCQNLCLLAKLFLGSKTLYYDVEPFLFYILCEYDECGYHFVGYFSKEKRASSQNNVSCILTLPIHQRKGYGNLLIDFSYLLTKVEQKTGSPEKPLSDMGLVSYRNYWRLEMCQYFLKFAERKRLQTTGLSVKQISDDTGMTADDVVSALEGLRALVRDPQTQLYAFRVDLDYCRQYVAKWESKGYVTLKPEALAWTPYVMGRSNAVNFELGPPISTIAPREEDEVKVQEGDDTVGPEPNPLPNSTSVAASQQGSDVPGEDDVPADEAAEAAVAGKKEALENKENAEPQDQDMEDAPAEMEMWAMPYKGIPPTRFEVFPPITTSRRAERSRLSVARPSAPRPPSSVARLKRPEGSSRRSAASRARSGSSRRKTGGTGRGPGRWPKGTKKSDYGNAASGPGLPPGWLERQSLLKGDGEGRSCDVENAEATDQPVKDEV
ncbi:hypothetical protein RJ55_10049 [Drechmeria coniospora]|nr:hypothetical protein RJ55_10049 [Drechmeria coniospora]